MSSRPKVNLHALSELKNTTDDAIAPYLNSLGFTQSHLNTDVRLVLGFAACLLAGVTFYQDRLHGFDACKSWTAYAVGAYFLLNALLSAWVWAVEGGTVYVGHRRRDGVRVVVSTAVAGKYMAVYRVRVAVSGGKGKEGKRGGQGEGGKDGGEVAVVEAANPFAGWFDVQGYFVPKPFEAFLRNSIPGLVEEAEEAEGKEVAQAAPGEKKSGKKGGKK